MRCHRLIKFRAKEGISLSGRLIVDVIAGARPNFMKIAALFAVAADFPRLQLRFIHTGQHYDEVMSDIFLKELNLPRPVYHLGVGSASHAVQTAEIMKRYEEWILKDSPHLCLVVGDVNSTIACALTASKRGIKVAHVEAGLRSFDWTMPEEINRILTDRISHFHFVTEASGVRNLKREGHSCSIHLVGNVMVDTLVRMRPKAEKLATYANFDVEPKAYAYLTLHRPSNVDDHAVLGQIMEQILWTAQKLPVIFAVHPRTRKSLEAMNAKARLGANSRLIMVDPQGYLESLSIMLQAKVVVTDSGGMQEETTALNIPCLTLRDNTERPVTIKKGSNTLIKGDWKIFRRCIEKLVKGKLGTNNGKIPYWDGKTGQRILGILEKGI